MNEHEYRKIVAGVKGGVGACFLRFVFGLCSRVYSILIRIRNTRYDRGKSRIHRSDAAVISVGNITVGGTGKTPFVIWLCRYLEERFGEHFKTVILTRGYKTDGSNGKVSDEPALLSDKCPHAKLIINSDRVDGANQAVKQFSNPVIVLDDGFQHRRLGRDINIVMIDATCPFGYGKLLPAGLLREPVKSLTRAHAAVITKTNEITEEQVEKIESQISSVNPGIAIIQSFYKAVCIRTLKETELNFEHIKGKKTFVFCGIANPDSFLHSVEELEVEQVGSAFYNDHHVYSAVDVKDICEQAKFLNAEIVLTTEKDWTKIEPFKSVIAPYLFASHFGYIEIEMRIAAGENELKGLIQKAIEGKIGPINA